MQIFNFVVMKTYCLRRHEEHILFHNLVSQVVRLCSLVLGPTPFRGGQLHRSLFPADSSGWSAQASAAQPLHLLPQSPPLMSSCCPGPWGFPERSVPAPCLRHLSFLAIIPWADPNSSHVPSPDPSRWVPFRMPLSVLPP